MLIYVYHCTGCGEVILRLEELPREMRHCHKPGAMTIPIGTLRTIPE
jgi:hypothetical protein